MLSRNVSGHPIFGFFLSTLCHFVIKIQDRSFLRSKSLIYLQSTLKNALSKCVRTPDLWLQSLFVLSFCHQNPRPKLPTKQKSYLFTEHFEKCSREMCLDTRLLASNSLCSVILSSKSKNEASYEAKLLFPGKLATFTTFS